MKTVMKPCNETLVQRFSVNNGPVKERVNIVHRVPLLMIESNDGGRTSKSMHQLSPG